MRVTSSQYSRCDAVFRIDGEATGSLRVRTCGREWSGLRVSRLPDAERVVFEECSCDSPEPCCLCCLGKRDSRSHARTGRHQLAGSPWWIHRWCRRCSCLSSTLGRLPGQSLKNLYRRDRRDRRELLLSGHGGTEARRKSMELGTTDQV